MTHQSAVDARLPERYLLGELTQPEIDRFESHLFECPDCSHQVQAGSVLAANLRAVFLEDAVSPLQFRGFSHSRQAPVEEVSPNLAQSGELLLCRTQIVRTPPGWGRSTPPQTVKLVPEPAEIRSIRIDSSRLLFELSLLPSLSPVEHYCCTLLRSDRAPAAEMFVNSCGPTVRVLLPSKILSPGDHCFELRQSGLPDSISRRYPFRVC